MKIQIEVSLLGEPKRKLWALVDNGSSHCFIAPRILSLIQLSLLDTLSSETITVTSATEVKESKALMLEVIVSINDLNFLQPFIITDSVQKHDAVLWMNFLKNYKVKTDHGDSSFRIGPQVVYAQSIVLYFEKDDVSKIESVSGSTNTESKS